jgi:hypothetical protein
VLFGKDVEPARKEEPLAGMEKEIQPLMDFRSSKTETPTALA